MQSLKLKLEEIMLRPTLYDISNQAKNAARQNVERLVYENNEIKKIIFGSTQLENNNLSLEEFNNRDTIIEKFRKSIEDRKQLKLDFLQNSEFTNEKLNIANMHIDDLDDNEPQDSYIDITDESLLKDKKNRIESFIEFESIITVSKEEKIVNCRELACQALKHVFDNGNGVNAEIFTMVGRYNSILMLPLETTIDSIEKGIPDPDKPSSFISLDNIPEDMIVLCHSIENNNEITAYWNETDSWKHRGIVEKSEINSETISLTEEEDVLGLLKGFPQSGESITKIQSKDSKDDMDIITQVSSLFGCPGTWSGNHVFLVINRDPNSDASRPENWEGIGENEVIICDPFSNFVCSSIEYSNHLQNFYRKNNKNCSEPFDPNMHLLESDENFNIHNLREGMNDYVEALQENFVYKINSLNNILSNKIADLEAQNNKYEINNDIESHIPNKILHYKKLLDDLIKEFDNVSFEVKNFSEYRMLDKKLNDISLLIQKTEGELSEATNFEKVNPEKLSKRYTVNDLRSLSEKGFTGSETKIFSKLFSSNKARDMQLNRETVNIEDIEDIERKNNGKENILTTDNVITKNTQKLPLKRTRSVQTFFKNTPTNEPSNSKHELIKRENT
jgi:hypothetical protein